MSNSGRGLERTDPDPNATYTDTEVRALVEGELRRLAMNFRYLHGDDTGAAVIDARAAEVRDGAALAEAGDGGFRTRG